ncbi:MAG: GGDEF domain-containing protein [Desulfovibrio sp.]|nr:GGDEF domain-containing protein [Desulfovibrio sp.]
MNNHSKRKRVIQLTVLMILISFLTTTLLSVRSLDSLIQKNEQSLTNLLSSGIHDAISSEVIKPCMVARTISSDAFLINLLRIEPTYSEDYIANRLNTYLSGIRKGIDFASAFIVSSAGRHIYGLEAKVRQQDPLNTPQDAQYEAFIRSGRPYLSVICPDPFQASQEMFFIYSRIRDEDGKVFGISGVGLPLTRIQDIMRNFELKYNVRICLMDWDEHIMLSSDMAHGTAQSTGIELPKDYQKHREYSYGADVFGGYVITRYLEEIGWFLVIQGEKAEGREEFSNLILENVIAIVVIFALLFIALHHLMRSERTHLEHRAFTDELTGIANRAGFENAFAQLHDQEEQPGALYILDLDHFKEVNDTLGHPVGDLLLQQTAKKIHALFRETDIVARLGGDEFLIFASGMQQTDLVVAKAQSLLTALRKQYTLEDGSLLTVTASIGVALYPAHGQIYEHLYKHADTALYTSKEKGRNRYTLFSQ